MRAALLLVPTRELALQTAQVCKEVSPQRHAHSGLHVHQQFWATNGVSERQRRAQLALHAILRVRVTCSSCHRRFSLASPRARADRVGAVPM